jgi:hypothetical protein
MLNRFRQNGAFLLVTVIFLMVAGGAMLYAVVNLVSVSSATSSVGHNGNMSLAAAQSGLKYCLAGLQTGDCTANPLISGVTAPPSAPCTITIAQNCSAAAAPSICAIESTAYCPSSSDAYRGGKKITIQVQKTTDGSVFYYQMIPASRLVSVP